MFKVNGSQIEEFKIYLAKFIALKGISENGEGVVASLKFLTTFIKEQLNGEVELLPTSTNPAIYTELRGKNSETVLLYGHYDVMEADDLGWQTPPFVLTEIAGRYYGRGCGDNKGQLLAQLLGIATYLREYGELPINLKILIEGQEEQGSRDLNKLVQKYQTSLLADIDYVLVIDGSKNVNGKNVIRLGNRGLLAFELGVKVATRDLHSGNFGNVSENAALKLIGYLNKCYDFRTKRVKIPEFYADIQPATTQELEWIKKLPLPQGQTGSNVAYYHKLMFEPTFNINGMQSGYTGAKLKTVIPHKAFIRCDCRLVWGQSPELIRNQLEQLYHEELARGELEIKFLAEIAPSKTESSSPYLMELIKTIREVTGDCLIEPIMPGTVPNYVWTDTLKVPTFTIPFANFDQNNHSVNENISRQAFWNGIEIIYHFLERKKRYYGTNI